MVVIERGMTPAKEAVWRTCYAKEDAMKLRWFQKNQQQLVADAERRILRKAISPEILAEVERMRQERYRNMERYIKEKGKAASFPDIDPLCIKNIMKPVDPNTKDLLYKSMGNTGRRLYLKTRCKIKPEDRYFFPECSSFVYGWEIVARTKNKPHEKDYGRVQVVKHSFYRRNGSLKMDPEFQKPPAADSPTICH